MILPAAAGIKSKGLRVQALFYADCRKGNQRPDGGVVVPEVPDVSLPVVPDVPDVPDEPVPVVPVPVVPVAPVPVVPVPVAPVPVSPVVPVVPVAPVPVVSPVVPVAVVPVVPLVPELLLGAVAVSPVPVVLVGSVFLQAARLAINAAANRIFDALLRAFICFTPRSRLSFAAVSR